MGACGKHMAIESWGRTSILNIFPSGACMSHFSAWFPPFTWRYRALILFPADSEADVPAITEVKLAAVT